MTEVEYAPWSWPNIRKRLEDLEHRVAALEGHDVDAVVSDEPAMASAQPDKPHNKPKRR